jgi:hypothetical protein
MLVGDLGDEAGAKELLNQITDRIGAPDAVVAALGRWQATPSLISAEVAQLEQVLRDHLLAHFIVARTFLPVLKARGGTYVFINGPLAFGPWEGTSLVSIASSAQQMLFKSLAKELDGSPARVVELVSYASLKDQQTEPSSPIPGEAVGAYVSQLVLRNSREMHGRSLQLRYLEQLKELGLEIGNNGSSHQSNFPRKVETTRTHFDELSLRAR